MKPVDRTTSTKIANASVFGMMMIVGIHVLGHGWQSLEKGSPFWWFVAFGQYGIFSVAVPFFFTCSGYFLAGHMDEEGWWIRECGKRMKSLLTPYLLWCVISALLSAGLDMRASGFRPLFYSSVSFWVDTFGFSPFRHPSLGPLWFVRALMLFVVASPVVYWCVRRTGFLILFVLYVMAGLTHPMGRFWKEGSLFFTYCFNLSGFFFFCLGIFGRVKNIALPNRGYVLALIVGLCLVFSGAYCNLQGIKLNIPQSGLVIPILLFGFWGVVPEARLPKWLTGTTFAIFLLHIPLYKILAAISPMRVDNVLEWIVKWIVGWGGSLVIAIVICRSAPHMAKALFGGRM